MSRIGKLFVALVAAIALAGCATSGVSKDYAAQLEAAASVQRAYADAEKARFNALSDIAKAGDATTRTAAVMALALGGNVAQKGEFKLPSPPESDGDKAYKWAALFAGPVTNIASGYFGYKLGVTQSNNATTATVAGYNTFGSIANSGFATAGNIATAGFGSAATIAGNIQAPQPNITLSGTGVIGAGSYSAPANSNNTTRTCTSGAGNGGGGGAQTGQGGGGTSGSSSC